MWLNSPVTELKSHLSHKLCSFGQRWSFLTGYWFLTVFSIKRYKSKFLFWDKLSLNFPGCPWTLHVAQAVLELTYNHRFSASRVARVTDHIKLDLFPLFRHVIDFWQCLKLKDNKSPCHRTTSPQISGKVKQRWLCVRWIPGVSVVPQLDLPGYLGEDISQVWTSTRWKYSNKL